MTTATEASTTVTIAHTEADVRACYPVIAQLRPQLDAESFVEQVYRQEKQGYGLAYLTVGLTVHAVAGFRMAESLAWGRYLYVDDLVTEASERSRGYGTVLLDWIIRHARTADCEQVHLDSGVHRHEAHRFYLRQGMDIVCHHFARSCRGGSGRAGIGERTIRWPTNTGS